MAIPDISFHLLISEIIRIQSSGSADTDMTSSLNTLDDGQMAAVKRKMKTLGNEIGRKSIYYILKDHIWLKEENSILRFICKEFWCYYFGKFVDRLQANNRGIFLLYDYNFKWLARVGEGDSEGNVQAARRYNQAVFSFVAGLIKGGMTGIGFEKKLKVEITKEEDSVKFTITISSVNG